jgi:hypothetical protein
MVVRVAGAPDLGAGEKVQSGVCPFVYSTNIY